MESESWSKSHPFPDPGFILQKCLNDKNPYTSLSGNWVERERERERLRERGGGGCLQGL